VYSVLRHPDEAGAWLRQICKLSSPLHLLSPVDLFNPTNLILSGVMPAKGPHAQGTLSADAKE
jgi:hypothetical protein